MINEIFCESFWIISSLICRDDVNDRYMMMLDLTYIYIYKLSIV